MFVVASTKTNTNANLIVEFLFRMLDVFKAYFDGKFGEEIMKDNFPLIYELLDGELVNISTFAF